MYHGKIYNFSMDESQTHYPISAAPQTNKSITPSNISTMLVYLHSTIISLLPFLAGHVVIKCIIKNLLSQVCYKYVSTVNSTTFLY